MINLQHEHWSNWSGSQKASPKIIQPSSLDALQSAVRMYPKIRTAGAGHSFSALAQTNDVLINLDHFRGIAEHDAALCQSTIYAGTRLYAAGEKLSAFNQALINQGDIDQQSLAGAVATGTHGTGAGLSCLSANVAGFELVTADGDAVWCDAEQNAELYQAGRISLGSLGIMTKIKMQCRPMYRLKEHIRLCSMDELTEHLDQWKLKHRHIEFWSFIHSPQVILKTLDETDEPMQPKPAAWLDEDVLLKFCAELTRLCPVLNPWLQKLVSVFVQPSAAVDWSSRIFPAVRETRFNEMEYQLPINQGLACWEELMHCLKKARVPMFFPIEFRYVRGDDIWLSPFYQQDSVSISVHQFYKQDYRTVFNLAEPIFWKYGARPHWGKLHSLQAAELRELYPKWDEFMQLRQQLDPADKWLNPYLEGLFKVK